MIKPASDRAMLTVIAFDEITSRDFRAILRNLIDVIVKHKILSRSAKKQLHDITGNQKSFKKTSIVQSLWPMISKMLLI